MKYRQTGIPARYQEYRPGTEYRLGIVEYHSRRVYQWNTGPVFYQSGFLVVARVTLRVTLRGWRSVTPLC